MCPTYQEPTKNLARRTLLEHAIASLSRGRRDSTLVRATDFQCTLDYASNFLTGRGFEAGRLYDLAGTAGEYLDYLQNTVGTRDPSQLKVLYFVWPRTRERPTGAA